MLHLDGSEGVLPAAGDPVLWAKPERATEAAEQAQPDQAEPDRAQPDPALPDQARPDPAQPDALTEVGHVTSTALHYELGPIALAVIKRSVDPAAVLVVRSAEADLAAAQETIVPTDAGAEANVPRLPRLGAVRRGA